MDEMTGPNIESRSGGIQMSIRIEAIGTDLSGKGVFCQQGQTFAICRHGAVVVLSYPLAPDQELTIRRLDTNKEADARVVGIISTEKSGFMYGVSFLDFQTDLWGIDFSATIASDQNATRMLFECMLCQAQKTLDLDEIEVQVFKKNQHIQRFCNSCSTTTSWRGTTEQPIPGADLTMKTGVQESGFVSHVQVNRRKYGRIRGSIAACLRRPGLTEEVVMCENRSRGGLRLLTSELYSKEFSLEVTAPYSSGTQNIFLPARIVYIQRRDSLFTLGIEYVKRTESQRPEGYSGSSGSTEMMR